MVTVVGGKLTTYRQLAEEAVDDTFARLGRPAPPCTTTKLPLPGAIGDLATARSTVLALGVSERTADRLVDRYGTRAAAVVRAAGDDPTWLSVLHEPTGAIAVEMLVAVREEFAITLTDVLARRTLLAFEPGHGFDVVDRAAEILGAELGWDQDRQAHEIAEYRTWVSRLANPASATAGAR
jgi:glycerol-3-phosphate dehydrogenase